jgi:hypothetical protein
MEGGTGVDRATDGTGRRVCEGRICMKGYEANERGDAVGRVKLCRSAGL